MVHVQIEQNIYYSNELNRSAFLQLQHLWSDKESLKNWTIDEIEKDTENLISHIGALQILEVIMSIQSRTRTQWRIQ